MGEDTSPAGENQLHIEREQEKKKARMGEATPPSPADGWLVMASSFSWFLNRDLTVSGLRRKLSCESGLETIHKELNSFRLWSFLLDTVYGPGSLESQCTSQHPHLPQEPERLRRPLGQLLLRLGGTRGARLKPQGGQF